MTTNFDETFDASFRRVLGEGAYHPGFTARFYEHFLSASDEVAGRFSGTDMSRQKTMLHDSLLSLVDFNRSRRLTEQMARLSRVHSRSGQDIPAHLYTLWLDALLATVREFDPEFSDTVDVAWRLSLAPGIAYLQFGYDR